MASWDDLYGLIQKYLRDNTAKEGVVKLLTKKQIGDHPSIGSRVTNPLNRPDLSLKELSREHQYYIFKQHEKDVLDSIIKTLKYVDEQGVQLGKEQLKNLEYNLGVVKLLRKDNLKSEGVLRKDYKLKPSEAFQAGKNIAMKKDRDGGGIMASANNLQDSIKEIMKLADEMKPENIAKKEAVEKAARDKMFKKKWHGRAYEGRSDQYRGLSYQLAKLHEAGIIELDPKIYDAVKEGKYHWAGAEMFAPDIPRIWRYHFGDEIFDKFDDVIEKDIYNQTDTFRGPDAMANWMKKEGIKPIKKKGPKDALDYMDETELIAHAEDAQNSIDIFKSDDNFYTNMDMSDADKAKNRMNAIVQNAEDKKKFLDALKKNYPKAYDKMDWKTAVDTTDASYKQDDTMDSVFKVISEGDEGFKEISEKLGITARPGDNLKLEDNVIKGPWKGSSKTTAPGTYTITDHIEYIKTLEPVEAMKEVNKVLKGEGKYKGISKKESDQIFTDTDDWINQRDPSDRWDYKNNRPYRDDPNFDPDDPDFDPDDGLYATGGRVGFDSGGDPLTRLKNQIVESMKPYAPGVSEDRLWIIVKDITLDMSPEQAQASAIENFKKGFATGGRVGYSQGGDFNYHWGHGDSNILDPEWDEGFNMDDTLRLLKQDQSGNQVSALSGDLDDLLQRLGMVVDGIGIYADYNQNQRKQMQRSLTNRINVLLAQ
jgi:hypothetical protein